MPETAVNASEPDFDEAPVRALLEDCDGDVDAIAELVELYLSQTVERVAVVRSAWDRGALEPLQFAAHDLKSTSGAFGAAYLSSVAGKLEQQARSRQVSPELVSAVLAAFERVHPALKDLLETLRKEATP